MAIEVATDQPFQHLARQANKLMEQMQKGYYNFCPSETWTPNVNLYETASHYLVCVDLAGVEKEKIDVEVVDGRLKLRGTRQRPSYGPGGAALPFVESVQTRGAAELRGLASLTFSA